MIARALMLAGLGLLPIETAWAGCPLPDGADPHLASWTAKARMDFLRHRLSSEAIWAQGWVSAWSLALTALTVGPMIVQPLSGGRIDFTDASFGALTATATLIALVELPLPLLSEKERDHLVAARHKPWKGRVFRVATPAVAEIDCQTLADEEGFFYALARREAGQKSLRAHLINLGINVGVAMLVLGAGFGHWKSAALGSMSGTGLGELMLLTKPNGLPSDWDAYLHGALSRPQVVPFVAPFAASGGIGLGAGVAF